MECLIKTDLFPFSVELIIICTLLISKTTGLGKWISLKNGDNGLKTKVNLFLYIYI